MGIGMFAWANAVPRKCWDAPSGFASGFPFSEILFVRWESVGRVPRLDVSPELQHARMHSAWGWMHPPGDGRTVMAIFIFHYG